MSNIDFGLHHQIINSLWLMSTDNRVALVAFSNALNDEIQTLKYPINNTPTYNLFRNKQVARLSFFEIFKACIDLRLASLRYWSNMIKGQIRNLVQ